MRVTLNERLEQISLKLDSNPIWQIDQLIALRILFQRTIEKREKEERIQELERRNSTSTSLSNTHEGIGLNQSTAMATIQAVGSFTPAAQAMGAIKGLFDQSKEGNRITLRNSIEKINQFLDDLRRGQQTSQESISGLFSLIKQIENEAHSAASRVASN